MPELKHNFIKGRMNLDLDERLVPDGEYRRAMNIEVDTSEGSNVGTVQSVMRNTSLPTNLAPDGGVVLGSYADGRTNRIYYFVECEESLGVKKDLIVEYFDGNGSLAPVVVDIYSIDFTLQNTISNGVIIAPIADINNASIRDDMVLTGVINDVFGVSGGVLTLSENDGILDFPGLASQNIGPIIVDHVVEDTVLGIYEIHIRPKSYGGPFTISGGIVGDNLTFVSKRMLNFKSSKNPFITGINIIDDLLFWTDNISEPKKVNIKLAKEGTPSLGVHSIFKVYASGTTTTLSPILQSEKFMKEEHITVVKKAPLTPPSLEMYNDINARGVVFGVTNPLNFSELVIDNPAATPANQITTIVPFANGTTVDITFPADMPEFLIGDILLITDDDTIINNPRIFTEGEIRVLVIAVGTTTLTVKILSFANNFFPYSVDAVTGLPDDRWAICLEQSKSLFEFKFPRFAYRYKYQDGEYSAFSPFSEVAFLPGHFNYDAKNAYNLGMVNQLRFLKILDFVPDGIPKGVVEVDILYKESNSPNIYTVKTLNYTDSEWHTFGHTTPQTPWTGITKGAIQLESEVIYATVPSNQLLRPWDNVPIKAKAQELSANRIIYGNYVEGYDLNPNSPITIDTVIKSMDLSNDILTELDVGKGGPSIK